tara:strand:- start:2845 stop:3534 length:690 start_codon:yes stop_codon:yes gene_type:complete
MAIITTNGTLGATAAITNTTLNTIANAATFASGAVDAASLEIISGGANNGKLGIKNDGVTTAKIDDSSSKTTGVTFAKMQHISTAKVLGRASASEGDVEEAFDFKDEDNMSSNSATALASQQSIKAYADAAPKAQMKADDVLGASVDGDTESVTLPNGLIMKFGEKSGADGTVTYGVDFPNEVISICLTPRDSSARGAMATITGTPSVSEFTIDTSSSNDSVYWQAIGR